jgi:hypothetical protein
MIRSPLPLTIPYWFLCLATLKLYLILAGRSRPRNGEPWSNVLNKGNHYDGLFMITAYHMRRSGVCCERRVTAKVEHTQGCKGRQRTQRVRCLLLVRVAHLQCTTGGWSKHGNYPGRQRKKAGRGNSTTAELNGMRRLQSKINTMRI